MIGGREEVVVKEYTPIHGGELVGWMNFTERDGLNALVGQIAIAKISREGAIYSYIEDDERKLYAEGHSIQGFEDSTELRIFAEDGKVADITAAKAPGLDEQGYRLESRDKDSGFADRLYSGEGSPVSDGVWVLGKNNIVNAIKTELIKKDARWMYGAVYYNLALMLRGDMLLVDTDMQEKTRDVLYGARYIFGNLQFIKSVDEEMATNLTVFGDIPPENIPDAFRTSRLYVARQEEEIRAMQDKSPISRWFLPIGHRTKGGRSWPYMDASTSDENVAFGRELSALQHRNVDPAVYELKREQQELDGRIESARRIVTRLGSLASQEAKALEGED